MEVYPGMDYEVTVWVKALSLGNQNIEFGVNCYDANLTLSIRCVSPTGGRQTVSSRVLVIRVPVRFQEYTTD